MRRTLATQLALVNWRGVFYERYLLDTGVTALEGRNGVGKTTVMVAAYIVLLPDQRYLHFEPLAEGGARADDRGIWGRLGEGPDAYAAIDFRLGNGGRLLAGVRLERKGKDSGELHPFLIRDLPPEAALQQLLLDRVGGHEDVPAPDRLAALAAVAGGRLSWCTSVSEYLRELFDAGVAPMPMSTDSERAKLNDLLRTSMMGGISRQLGDGLRGFLLRPEEGLGQTLQRIRSNLDDCRRTRMQVSDSRRLEVEIHEVLDAGAHMFAAAVEGARRFAEERQRQADDARNAENEARAAHVALVTRHEDATAALTRAEEAEAHAKTEADQARLVASQVERANEIWKARQKEEIRRGDLAEKSSAVGAIHALAVDALQTREELVRAREIDHQSAAKGMADIQKGLERLHAHASRFRAVQSALRRARKLLPELEFSDEEVPAVLARCEREALAASAALATAKGKLQTAEQTERAFREVHVAVEKIAGRAIADADAHLGAREVLAELRREDTLVERLPLLRKDRQEAVELSKRQVDVRRRAAALTSDDEPLTSAEDLRRARDRCSVGVDGLSEAVSIARDRHAELLRSPRAQETAVEALRTRGAEHRRLKAAVDALAHRWERTVVSSAELAALHAWLQAEYASTKLLATSLETEAKRLEAALAELRNGGGAFPAFLTSACERVEGRLLIERFEDVPFNRAAEMEARLGPLVHAILVDDPQAAAHTLAEVESRPDTLWLLDGPRTELSPEQLPAAHRRGDAVVVPQGSGVCLTRLPKAPVVGRQARERVIRDLEGELRATEDGLADSRARIRLLAADIKVMETLLPKAELLDWPDPEGELTTANARLGEIQRDAALAEQDVGSTQQRLGVLKLRKQELEALWADANLLDPPDQSQRVAVIEAQILQAVGAQRHLETNRENRRTLDRGLSLLLTLPLDVGDRADLHQVVHRAQESQQRWLAPQADLEAVGGDLKALGFTAAEEMIRKDEDLLASLNREVEAAERLLVDVRNATRSGSRRRPRRLRQGRQSPSSNPARHG